MTAPLPERRRRARGAIRRWREPWPGPTGGSGCWRAGVASPLAGLAAAGRIGRSNLHKTLRLTLLAPGIVQAILDGRRSCHLAKPALLESLPSLWNELRSRMAEPVGCAP